MEADDNAPPLEQLAQQQRRTPVAFVRFQETPAFNDRGLRFHLLALDTEGVFWERWSDEPDGAWHKLTAPLR